MLENMKYESAAVFSAGALAFLMLSLQGLPCGADDPEGQPRMDGRGAHRVTHIHPRGAARPQREKKI